MSALVALTLEIERQRSIHPDGYPATRNGIRLGLACAQDEVLESLDEWRLARCKCNAPDCAHPDWSNVREEALQAAAVLLRIVTSIDMEAPR